MSTAKLSRKLEPLPNNPEPRQQLELLRAMSENAAFRARLQSEPRAALSELGIELDPAMVPEQVTLPSLEALRDGTVTLADKNSACCFPWWQMLTDHPTFH